MKKVILSSVLFLSCLTNFAGEFTGAGAVVNTVLTRAGFTPQGLRSQGLRVVAPKGNIQLDDIRYIVTSKKLLEYRDLDHIDFKVPSSASSLSDVRSFEARSQKVRKSEVKALIVD